MSNRAVLWETREGVCTITMNRPEAMNSFGRETGPGLLEAFEGEAADPAVRVVVLTGAGGNFSSGADMGLLAEGTGPGERLAMMKGLSRLIRTMRTLPLPIVAKVRGVAYGVGSNLALASDFVIAAHDARICEVFVNIGVVLDGGGTYFLPRLVGNAKARELALLGEEVDGPAAAEMGLIYRSVPEVDLDREVDALAAKLCRRPRAALALIKEGLEGSLEMDLDQALEWEGSHQSIMLQTPEHKEAVRRFLESRGKRGG